MEESDKRVRVRFAPSPTGSLHIGGARTAYFNWLFARKNGGQFVLRIDDTDVARSTEQSYQAILDGFKWLGLTWDEGPGVGGPFGPYRQSERTDIYRSYLAKMISDNQVYACFCTSEQLAEDREQAQREGRAPRYSGRCRHLSHAEVNQRIESGERAVYRFRSPAEGETVVHDVIRGDVIFRNEELDDFVVWKSDGSPTYHFATCVDDGLMEITHVIRAEEHLSNTPKHVVLFHAMGFPLPLFAHVPMILAPDRSKLSKRHGATSVQEYRDLGILPTALVNYLLLLGFSPGEDREIVSQDEAISLFQLDKVTRHAAVYDTRKLEWLNSHYTRARVVDEWVEDLWSDFQERGWVPRDPDVYHMAWIRTVVQTVQQRARHREDLMNASSYFFETPSEYDEKGVKKYFSDPEVAGRLRFAADALSTVQPFSVQTLDRLYRTLAAQHGLKPAQLIHPTRLAISGGTVGPGLFDVMALLGRTLCQNRMRAAAAKLENGSLLGLQ